MTFPKDSDLHFQSCAVNGTKQNGISHQARTGLSQDRDLNHVYFALLFLLSTCPLYRKRSCNIYISFFPKICRGCSRRRHAVREFPSFAGLENTCANSKMELFPHRYRFRVDVRRPFPPNLLFADFSDRRFLVDAGSQRVTSSSPLSSIFWRFVGIFGMTRPRPRGRSVAAEIQLGPFPPPPLASPLAVLSKVTRSLGLSGPIKSGRSFRRDEYKRALFRVERFF